MVSKMLKATDHADPSRSIGEVLGVPDTSAIHQRVFRNRLEHYDKQLKSWIRKFGANVNIGTYNIGPKSAFKVPNLVYINHYDPNTKTFTFVNEDFDLSALSSEVEWIRNLADVWVNGVESEINPPPYI